MGKINIGDIESIEVQLAKQKNNGQKPVIVYYPTSSNLYKSTYYPLIQYLEMIFKNKKSRARVCYAYDGVPQRTMDKLYKATSHGSYFYYNIRTDFNYRKLF